ncbi:MAG: Hpt domain-containing protein [Clostridiales bacterium]|nr:Hpt domain-containing protein [Clostridiales bacterium]
MMLLERLKDWGCDTDAALKRVVDDKELYCSLLTDYRDTFDVAPLREMIRKNQCEQAFDAAHGLKGVFGNLGLQPLFDPISRITEVLRSGSCEGLEKDLRELEEKKAEFDAILDTSK